MSIVRGWFERLSPELRELATEVIATDRPTDEQLEACFGFPREDVAAGFYAMT